MLRLNDHHTGYEICLADEKSGRVYEILDMVPFSKMMENGKSFQEIMHERVMRAQGTLRVKRFTEELKRLREEAGI